MSISYIHAQIQSAPSTAINAGANLIFNTLVQSSDDMNINQSSGRINLNTPGLYYIQWQVSLSGENTAEPAVLTLSTSQGDAINSTGAVNTGEIASSTIIKFNQPGTVFLVNETPGLTLSAGAVSGNILIYAIDQEQKTKTAAKLTIPFSSGHGYTCRPGIDEHGTLTQTSVIGSGGLSSANPTFYLPVLMGRYFTIPFLTDKAQYLFSLPYNATLVAASVIFNNYDTVDINQPTAHISPYIAIATPTMPATYNFEIQEDSKVYPAKGYIGNNPPSTVLTVSKTDLNVPVPAGTPFAIVAGLKSLSETNAVTSYWIYMHGSLVFEVDEA